VVASLDGIADGVRRVLDGDEYRDAARAVAAEMRRLPPVDDFLESL
jgi:UDP:flavonoid glycosyltransferase YjiC (YdhE family)